VASTTTFAGAVIDGAVVSTTCTTNVPEVVFPASSVAVQLTLVSPRWKRVPDSWLHETVAVPPSSVAVAV
jgi:hypothetical protein